MRVEVRLYGSLRRYRPSEVAGLPDCCSPLRCPGGESVDDLGGNWASQREVNAAAVNDEAVENSTILREGDRVSLFPPSAGGSPGLPGR